MIIWKLRRIRQNDSSRSGLVSEGDELENLWQGEASCILGLDWIVSKMLSGFFVRVFGTSILGVGVKKIPLGLHMSRKLNHWSLTL
jgi:hypothetical protein